MNLTRVIIVSLLCFIGGEAVFGQSNELKYQNGVWQNGGKLTSSEVRDLMSYNSDALKLYKNGKALEIAGYIVSVPSAFILGYDLGGRLTGADGNNAILVTGAIGTAAGLLIGLTGEKKIKQSVNLHNLNLKNVSCRFDLGLTHTGGVGLTVNF